MTKTVDSLRVETKVVVMFDMCSSSKIVENLTLTDSLGALRNFLIRLKRFIQRESRQEDFEVYKFIGDGWILLFPEYTKLPTLLAFLERLSRFYKQEHARALATVLEIRPKPIGLKFGVDRGRLVRIVMLGKPEYVGRPLNVASRLQDALSLDDSPPYKVLISRPAAKALGPARDFKSDAVRVSLKNIQDESPYRCVKFTLDT